MNAKMLRLLLLTLAFSEIMFGQPLL